MQKINAWVYRCLHLVPHDQIFVIQLVIRTVIKCTRQKPHHIILIEIHVADITLVIFIIDKIHAGITVRNFLHLITPLPKAPCNFAVLPPVPNRYKYAILLNIYDKRSDCKGVPEMKISEISKKAPNTATDCRFGAHSRKRAIYLTNPRSFVFSFTESCRMTLLHLTVACKIRSGHLCAQHLVQFHAGVLIVRIHPENTYQIECDSRQDLP